MKLLPLVNSLLVPVLAAGLLAGCGSKHESQRASVTEPASAEVKSSQVEERSHPVTEEVLGTVRAKLRATLEAKVSGRIAQMPVVLGQQIKAGQLLAVLDAAEIKAKLDEAEAARQQAERDWKRASSLLEQQALTRSEYEVAESRFRVAEAALAGAKAMLGYIEVRAPFDGVITRKLTEVGDLAAPGKGLLELEDPSNLQVEADIPEAISAKVRQGSSLEVRVDGESQVLKATVSEISPNASPESRTRQVKLDLPKGSQLMPGQFARLSVPIGEGRSLRVPAAALIKRGQLEIVFVSKGQRANLHLVKSGRRFGDEIEILAGLDPGDMVVTEGAALLRDGQPVISK